MSAALVLPAADTATVDQMVAQCATWEAMIRSEDNVGQLADIAERAKMLRAFVKIRKMAAEVAHAAFRLEAVALRRLWQLGCRNPGQYGSAAVKGQAATLAELSDADFDAGLADGRWSAIGSWVNEIRKQANIDSATRLILDGDAWADTPHSFYGASRRLERAASELLEQVTTAGDEFTTATAASSLLDRLGIDEDDVTVKAARAAIREALHLDDGGAAGSTGEYDLPRIVTYRHHDVWVRVPTHRATLAQLAWMAEFRMRQAEELMIVARCLRDEVAGVCLAAKAAGYDPTDELDAAEFKVRWAWDGVPTTTQRGSAA
jgi:hypothetical protein